MRRILNPIGINPPVNIMQFNCQRVDIKLFGTQKKSTFSRKRFLIKSCPRIVQQEINPLRLRWLVDIFLNGTAMLQTIFSARFWALRTYDFAVFMTVHPQKEISTNKFNYRRWMMITIISPREFTLLICQRLSRLLSWRLRFSDVDNFGHYLSLHHFFDVIIFDDMNEMVCEKDQGEMVS